MMSWETATLADCLGDLVVYRGLEPSDPTFNGLSKVWRQIGLTQNHVPRKGTAEHAAYLWHLMTEVNQKRGQGTPRRLAVIGDTASGDGAVARQLRLWVPTWAFIGNEQPSRPAEFGIQDNIALATRWECLQGFNAYLLEHDFVWNEEAALLLDLDKSLIGARGRNDQVIDEARVAAVKSTLCGSLADSFSDKTFRRVYDQLNQAAYHFITADNQDFLAYICLMTIGGIVPEAELWPALEQKALSSIEQFASLCEMRRNRMTSALRAAHDEVCAGLKSGDPTPFKEFRYAEYQETIRRMNVLPGDAAPADVLAHEITITAEVFALAKYAASKGALVVGISDKPDEASKPSPALAALGYQPIHRTAMKVFGRQLSY